MSGHTPSSSSGSSPTGRKAGSHASGHAGSHADEHGIDNREGATAGEKPAAKLARDIMTKPAISVGQDANVGDIARIMQEKDIGCVVVVDKTGMLKGVITESDFTGVGRCVPFSLELAPVIFGRRAATLEELTKIFEQGRKLKASDVMSSKVTTVTEDEELGGVVHLMLTKGRKHVPVVREGRPVGMIARHDILKLFDNMLIDSAGGARAAGGIAAGGSGGAAGGKGAGKK